MLKILVFDGGWGGELVADFLMEELTTVEVVRVIDWPHAPYAGKSQAEICQLVESGLRDYIGEVDVIVLGGYLVSLALDGLRRKYSKQKFVGMGVNYDLIARSRCFPGRVLLLMDELLKDSELLKEIRQTLPYSTLVIPDCSGWEEAVNDDSLTPEILRQDLGYDFVLAQKLKAVPTPTKKGQDFANLALRAGAKLGNQQKMALKAAIMRLGQAAELASMEEALVAREIEYQNTQMEHRNEIRPDVILLLNTHFWEVKLDLEAIFGYKVRVLDFREKLLHDVCAALKLRGVHGRRAK